jgi:alpha-amylase
MTSLCFYFQVHQPFRLNWFWPESASNWKGSLQDLYFDKGLNEFTFRKVAGKCYHPANDIILSQIDRFKNQQKQFKVSYSLSGTFLDQCERWDKDLLEKFKQMAESGCVEFLTETYYHSLSSLYEDKTEFLEQVKSHQQAMRDLLGAKSKVFRNTELLYHNDIAKEIEKLGFSAIMTEGIERILDGWRSPNFIYKRQGGDIRVLLRNYRLSDDIGYRFSSRWWSEYPLTADKYAAWLAASQGDTINVFVDYETFGEHQWEDTGIFWFLGALPQEILKWQNLEFSTPTEVVERYPPVGDINVPYYETVSWADLERDASAWLGNHMQQLALTQVKKIGKLALESGNPDYIKTWRYLQTGDHFYYMCTKCLADGDVHKYFSHHGNPYDAGINYLSVLSDFKERILKYIADKEITGEPKKKPLMEMSTAQEIKPPEEKPPAPKPEAKTPQPIEKPQLLRAKKTKPTAGYRPKAGEIMVGEKLKTHGFTDITSRKTHIIQGIRITPEEKYAHGASQHAAERPKSNITPGIRFSPMEKYAAKYQPVETPKKPEIRASKAAKNSQLIKAKRITPEGKYKPKSR